MMDRTRRKHLRAEAVYFAGRMLDSECDSFEDWDGLTEAENQFVRDTVRKQAASLMEKGRPRGKSRR
jgi:hypothetical protein